MKNPKVLVACEESQAICKAFRNIGIEAYSCDIQECSGGHPEWHIMGDTIPLLNGKCKFTTQDGIEHIIDSKWDLIIAHPPCTRLCNSGQRWLYWGGQKNIEPRKRRNKKKPLNFSWRLLMQIVIELLLRTLWELCLPCIKNQVALTTLMILKGRLNARRLVFG